MFIFFLQDDMAAEYWKRNTYMWYA